MILKFNRLYDIQQINNKLTKSFYIINNRKYLSTLKLRELFLNHFQNQNYQVLPSSPILPSEKDKSILFTNAGMVQFKEWFLNPFEAKYPNVATVQKCLRAGGKSNDLENVGFTKRHLTFFEMLGTFSFGKTTEKEAICQAYDFLTKVLKLDPKRLRVTIMEGDQTTKAIWKQLGFPEKSIVEKPGKENFWSMGDPTDSTRLPCGPCTEIFYDLLPGVEVSDEDDKWLEIWNLVFMRYSMGKEHDLKDLDVGCIDTGMGLERLASVLQGKDNNFEIDTFQPIIDKINDYLKTNNFNIKQSNELNSVLIEDQNQIKAFKQIIADHIRSIAILISEGVLPSNVGRGYVLRRILRRCLRAIKQLGINDPNFLPTLMEYSLNFMPKSFFPLIHERIQMIQTILKGEEQIFSKALERGLIELNQAIKDKDKISGELAFILYDRYGFPIDLTVAIAKSYGSTIDIDEFESYLNQQKLQSKAQMSDSQTLNIDQSIYLFKDSDLLNQSFTGYNYNFNTVHKSKVIHCKSESSNNICYVILDKNPFYHLGGGQENDYGKLVSLDRKQEWQILEIESIEPQIAVLKIKGDVPINLNENVDAKVDKNRRFGLRRHHSATHLLNAALKKVLNYSVLQAGSLVQANRLRFDFTYPNSITKEHITTIEKEINQNLTNPLNHLIETTELPYEEAIRRGAVATFTERYPPKVRMIQLGNDSIELCSGTHVQDLNEMYPFLIISSSAVASGTKRIEAICGEDAIKHLLNRQYQYREAFGERSIPEIERELNSSQVTIRTLQKANKKLTQNQGQSSSILPRYEVDYQLPSAKEINTIVSYWHSSDTEQAQLLAFARNCCNSEPNKLHLLIAYPRIMLMRHPSLSTPPLGKCLSILLKGKGRGGGSPELAMGKIDLAILEDGKVELEHVVNTILDIKK